MYVYTNISYVWNRRQFVLTGKGGNNYDTLTNLNTSKMIEQLSNDDGSLADLLQSYNYQKQLEEFKLVSKDYTMDHFQRQ